MMSTTDSPSLLGATLAFLLTELVDGPPGRECYMLNPGDPGLLGSLERLSAEAASRRPAPDAASIAAHVAHVRYGLSLMNRWASGEPNPFASADWGAAWSQGRVDDEAWRDLRHGLGDEARRWMEAVGKEETTRGLPDMALRGIVGSVAHLAYHLGAIRQIDRTAAGPKEGG